jgi:NAD-dependent deacetylase
VDGFHQLAGNNKVHELHGSIRSCRCSLCRTSANLSAFLKGESCVKCGGKLRPNVVLFGEMLPEEPWDEALTAIKRADLIIVMGTSLQVYPVNQLPSMTNGKTVIINLEPTEMDKQFDLAIHGKAGKVLKQVNEFFTPD